MSGAHNDDPPRGRRSTLECFNDELSVLERPLENDVEYFEDPPPSRWRGRGVAVIVAAAVVGCGAFLLRANHRTAVASAPPRQEAAKQDAPAAASPPVLAIAPIPVAKPEVPPEPEAAPEPEAPGDLAEVQPPPSRVAWTKVRVADHPKHARAGKSHARSHHRGR